MPDACDSWHIAWHTRQWREATYVGEQLLRGWSIRGSSCHGCEVPSLERFQVDAAAAVSEREQPPTPALEDCSVAVVRIRQWPYCAATAQIAHRYRAAGLRHFFVLVGEEHERSCATCPEFFAIAPLVVRHYHESSCDSLPTVLTLPMGVVAGTTTLHELAPQRTGGLTNTHPDGGACMRWAVEGQCQSNPAFMLTSCTLSCSAEDNLSLRGQPLMERPASRRRLAWSFASGVHSVARTRLAEFLQGSAAASAMAHTLYYPWAPRPGERQASDEYLRTLCASAFVPLGMLNAPSRDRHSAPLLLPGAGTASPGWRSAARWSTMPPSPEPNGEAEGERREAGGGRREAGGGRQEAGGGRGDSKISYIKFRHWAPLRC